MRAVSKKRARVLRERRKLTDAMKANGRPSCVNCGRPADDAHELLSRARGGSLTDPANVVAICRQCHIFATEHPLEAGEMGLVK